MIPIRDRAMTHMHAILINMLNYAKEHQYYMDSIKDIDMLLDMYEKNFGYAEKAKQIRTGEFKKPKNKNMGKFHSVMKTRLQEDEKHRAAQREKTRRDNENEAGPSGPYVDYNLQYTFNDNHRQLIEAIKVEIERLSRYNNDQLRDLGINFSEFRYGERLHNLNPGYLGVRPYICKDHNLDNFGWQVEIKIKRDDKWKGIFIGTFPNLRMAVLAYIIAFRNYYFPKNNDLTTIPSDHQINEAQKHAKGWRLLPSRRNSENLDEHAIEELEKHIKQQMNDLNQEPIPQQRAAAAAAALANAVDHINDAELYDDLAAVDGVPPVAHPVPQHLDDDDLPAAVDGVPPAAHPVPQHLDDPNNENSAIVHKI